MANLQRDLKLVEDSYGGDVLNLVLARGYLAKLFSHPTVAWMGGLVPLGYDAKDRTLVVNEAEAGTVRMIFQLYLELGCARRVKEAADRQGLLSKISPVRQRGSFGGVAFTRGRIYHLLANPVYIGEIRHKGRSYPGQHPAIIDRATFDAVN